MKNLLSSTNVHTLCTAVMVLLLGGAFFSVAPVKGAGAASKSDLQRVALENLYQSTGGSGWTDHSGWLEGDYCPSPESSQKAWFGIVCDEGGFVKHLLMEKNGLRGTLPAELFTHLPLLEHANFALNEISGTIPSSLCNAPHLQKLFLQINPSLSGGLPCLPGSLDTIIIEQTQVGGLIPTTLSGNLKILILSGSRFEGPLPDIFDSMPDLEILIMNGRVGEDGKEYQLTGTIPPSVWRLSKLKFLSLQFNHLEGSLGSFTKMKSIDAIHLNNNFFSGTIPESLAKVLSRPHTDLDSEPDRHLHLENNQFNGTLSPKFLEITGITELGLSNNRFTGYIPTNFKDAKWRWYPETGQALASNDWLPPVPEWAVEMGAAAVPLQPQEVTPAICPAPKLNVTIGGDSFLDLPTLACAIANSPLPMGSACDLPDCVITPAVYDAANVQYLCKPVELEHEMSGNLFATMVYTEDAFLTSGSETHIVGSWVPLLVYEPHPQIEAITPSEGRWQGCTNVTLLGKGFVDTKKMFCYFNGTKDSQRAPAMYLSPTAVFCLSPGFPDAKKASAVNVPFVVSYSPYAGQTFSKPNPSATFLYTDYCPLTPYDANAGNPPCDCKLCPCASAGTCVWAHTKLGASTATTTTPKGPYCLCPEGFVGDNCEKCLPGRWGAQCLPCSCANGGVCRDGKSSDGSCRCPGWYIGRHCEFYYKNVLEVGLAVIGVGVLASVASLFCWVCASPAPPQGASPQLPPAPGAGAVVSGRHSSVETRLTSANQSKSYGATNEI